MNDWERKLIGELIGLARATDGNEHLISESVTTTIADILNAHIDNEAQYVLFSNKIEAAKLSMVPDCFHCANPCGRTAACDLRLLEGEQEPIRKIKYTILEDLRAIAASQRDPEMDLKLYHGLVIIGLEGYTSAELEALFSGA